MRIDNAMSEMVKSLTIISKEVEKHDFLYKAYKPKEIRAFHLEKREAVRAALKQIMPEEAALSICNMPKHTFVEITGQDPDLCDQILNIAQEKTGVAPKVRYEMLLEEWRNTPKEWRSLPDETEWSRYHDDLIRLKDEIPYEE